LEARPSASTRYVYFSGIEAWTVLEFRRILLTIVRILEPGGIVRIVAKDLDAIVYGYLLEWNKSEPNEVTRAQQLNAWRRSETAEYVFNEEDLRAELDSAGFVDIWRLQPGASSAEIFHKCEQSGSAEMVLEARKPAVAE
jgi:hypothetical protein